jgi:hypothetical protein
MLMDSENYKPVGCCDKCKAEVLDPKWQDDCLNYNCPCHQDLGQTELREWEERLDKRWNLWHKSDDENYNFTTCQEAIKTFISDLLLSQEKRHREELDKLLEQGHGGGNFRRLIMQLRDKNNK